MFCPKCGRENEDAAAFCFNCGARFELLVGQASDGASVSDADRIDSAATPAREDGLAGHINETVANVGDVAKELRENAKGIASTALESAAQVSAAAGAHVGDFGKAIGLRIAICLVVLVMLFVPWIKYSGALSGDTFIWLSNLSYFGLGFMLPLAIIGLIIMVAGVAVEAAGKVEAGRVVFTAGATIVGVLALIIIIQGSNSLKMSGAPVASVSPTIATWLCLILAVGGIASQFWHPKEP